MDKITFKWEITDDDLTRLWSPSWPKDGNDYCGHVFFGPFKVEFIWNDDVDPRNYTNVFQFGIGSYGDICGIPYDMCDEIQESMLIPALSNLEDFIRACEDEILSILRANPYLIEQACQDVDPNEWFKDRTYRVTLTHTHVRDL